MDWLTFCVFIWVLCVSTSISQPQLHNSTSSLSDQFRSACQDSQPVVPLDQCNTCICFAGLIYCTNIPCPEQDCINGVDLSPPDACNKCICRRGKVTCSTMICIPAPHCAENKLYPAQNKCNACMCLNGLIVCTSNDCTEELLLSTIPTTTTKLPKKKKKCIEGDSFPGPNECFKCFCQNGRKRCKYICNPILESRFSQGPECYPGQHIPRPDDCNNCICFEGQIHCTHLPCRMDTRIGPECNANQPVYRPDECNECYCFEGRLECSDLVCIRGSKCVQGQVIPKPDSCNACKCVEGHILCTNYQCPTPNSRNALRPGRLSTEERTLDECQEGDIISPPPPPNDCNMCYCMDNRILCTTNSCKGSDPEIKGRQSEPNKQTDLQIFDKQISVEPFINMLSKNYEKLPTKLIHTHTYNGFHQEIKVHASQLPKDATKLLKVLATSLDNAALASISQRLLTSSNSLSSNHNSKIPLDHQVVQTNSLGEGNVLTTQSSKLITSGSQSNETILVIPNTEPFDGQNSQSILPLASKHETIWKSISSPASLVFNNNQQINPHSSQDEKLNVYYSDNPPSMFTSIDQNNVIRKPSKFGRPGLPHVLLIHSQSIYPASNPKSININDGKMSYAPFSQENKQFKPIPFGFLSKHDELSQLRPYQLTSPDLNQVFNYTLSTPMFRPGKFIVTPNSNDGQQKPSQSQFIPNLSKYYPNHVKPQEIQFKPNQNHLPTLNNKGIQHRHLFPNNPNQPIVAANQYKKPQFELKPDQGSVSPLNNKGNQTDQQFKAFPPNFQINPPLSNLPNPKKRISSIADEGSKEIPPHSIVPNSTAYHTHILNPLQIGVVPEHTQHKPPHSQFVPNPSIYYRNEYEAPKIIEVNPNQEQLIPHSKISYTHTEPYNLPHTFSQPGHDTLIPKVRNETRKYNTTHSHYEKHTTITYVSEHDPTYPANPFQIVLDPNQHQNAPQNNVYEHYLPDQESQELDLTMSKVNYYLNLPNLQLDQYEPHPKLTHYYSSQTTLFPGQQQNYTLKVHPTVIEMNKYNQHDSWNITNYQFDTYRHSPSDGKNADQIKSYQNRTNPTIPMYPYIFENYPHSSFQSLFIPSQDNSKIGESNDPISVDGPQSLSNSAENSTHPKSNKHLPLPSQTGPTENKHPPGVFDDRGSTNGFQHANNTYEDPRQLKPVHKFLPSKLETPQNHQLPGFFDKRASADGFQYPSNSAENPIHSRGNLHNPKLIQFGPTQNHHLLGMFDERGSADGFQHPFNSAEKPLHPKENRHKPPNFPFGSTIHKQLPGMFDERGSADVFQYPSNSVENPTHLKHNKQIQPNSPFGPAQNKHLPGMFDERGSADGYLSNSAEKPLYPKENIHNPPNSLFGPTTYKQLQGMYPSNSAGNPTHLKNLTHPEQNKQKQPHSQVGPNHNKPTPGKFDGQGSPDGFQYSLNSPENPLHPKDNLHYPPHSQFGSPQNQHLPGVFHNRGSPGGFQYPSNSVENPTHLKDNLLNPPQSQFLPFYNQYTSGVFDDRGSVSSFRYPSNSAENPTHLKHNNQIQHNSPMDPIQNQNLPGMFGERGSADGFQYPSNSVEIPTHPKDSLPKLQQSLFLPFPNQHLPGMFDERGSADRFQYPSNSAENPTHAKNNSNTTPESKFKQPQNQPKPSSLDDGYNNNNPLRPWMHLDHDQYKPSSFDNLLNGVHNIPWSVPNQDNDALGSDAEITTPSSGFYPKQDPYGPSMVNDPSISNQKENTDLTNIDDNHRIEQEVSTPSTDLTDSVNIQYNLLPKLKHDIDPDSLPPTDDGKIPDYYDQLHPLFKAVKKLSDPPTDDSVFSVGSIDQLDFLPFLFPGIAKILNYEQSNKLNKQTTNYQDDAPRVQNYDVQRINSLSKLKSKLKRLPENDNGILNWLKSKLNKLVPTKDNATVTKNNIDMNKIFNLLSKLTPSNLKHTAVPQNIPFSGFDPEIIENVINDFKEDILTKTSTPRTDSAQSYENRFRSVPTIPEESRPETPQSKYPDVHIILHRTNYEDDVDLPPYVETDGEINLATNMDSEELSASMFPKMFDSQFRHRPKDLKEECGHGTQWISNCHGCSCYFGQAMCFSLPDCKLRPLGEPMTCKPYTHFNMGCYTCECTGDGVAECDATDCNPEPSGKSRVSGSTETPLPIFNEFFDSKDANYILQYYNFYKNLPKDCPKQDLQTQYPTCERGTSWVSSCHKCECNESGKHKCIKIDDCKLDVESYGKPGRCKPNSKFYPKTNSMPCVECSCNDEGLSYCPAADYKKH